MLSALSKYSMFYKNKHTNRKLEWHHALGTATVMGRFPGGNKELSVTLFQATVLLLFNDAPRLTLADIRARTHLGSSVTRRRMSTKLIRVCTEDGELKRTLQSLALGRHRVLRKLSAGREIQDDDEFEYNEGFTDARTKLRIPSIQAPTETVRPPCPTIRSPRC